MWLKEAECIPDNSRRGSGIDPNSAETRNATANPSSSMQRGDTVRDLSSTPDHSAAVAVRE